MLRERVAPQSEVIRVIVLEDSPCCAGPHRLAALVAVVRAVPEERSGGQCGPFQSSHSRGCQFCWKTLPPPSHRLRHPDRNEGGGAARWQWCVEECVEEWQQDGSGCVEECAEE